MILFLGAHPDDIELGCGGSVSKTEDDKIGVTFTCQSDFKHMKEEMLNSWKILGLQYKEVKQDFKHRQFDRQELLDTLITLRDEYKPRLVLTHSSFDIHQDHRVIHEETVRAFKHVSILGYNLEWNNVGQNNFPFYVTLTADNVNAKIQSLACYKSQWNRTYFDSAYQRAQLIVNGQQCGSTWAEKFEVIRWIE